MKMMLKDDKKRFTIISFALYMFMYMTLLTAINQEASGIVGPQVQLTLYYVDMFCVTLGFVLYGICYDVFRKRRFPFYTGIINTIVLLSIFLIKTEMIFMTLAPIVSLFLGFFGGFFYTYMALSLQDDPEAGMIMGIAMSIAVFLQWFLQIFIGIEIFFTFVIDVLVMIFLIFFRDRFDLDKNILETQKVKMTDILPVMIVTGIIFLVFSFDNRMEQIITNEQFQTINIYTWPRLFLIAAYLGFGYFHDRFAGAYDQLCALMAALLSIISLILLTNRAYLNLSMIIFYLELGLLISYYNLIFWKICLNKKYLSLWASMGRILDGGISILLALFNQRGFDLFTEIIIDIIVIIMIVILIAFENRGRMAENRESDTEKFIKKYKLTEREKDVFYELLKPEIGVEQMAEDLFISRRTLQRHISSIYDKCSVSNRAGLIALVYRK